MTDLKAIDVMGFAGSFAAGVDQAGFDIIGKREPTKFGGFGMQSVVYNMPWLRGEDQLAMPDDWDPPSEKVQLVYGCPPCSGFSQLSHANTIIHGNVVGPEAEINECMGWFCDYVARVKPEVAIMESVGVAFKSGRAFMENLYHETVRKSGVDYYLTHVNMNASLVGGDVVRPRYFMVMHRDPFGVGLDFVSPRPMSEVLADLPAERDWADDDWGHQTHVSSGTDRWEKTLAWLKENNREWRQGTRLPDNNEGLEPPEFWRRADGRVTERSLRVMGDVAVYSHWYSTDPFSTLRWRWDRPYGVVVAAVLDRAIHPIYDRNLTFREAARFMSLPDTWSLRSLVERQAGGELGKAVPAASGKWIAHWAKQSILGVPGEFAGVQDTSDDHIRVIQVQNEKQVDELIKRPPEMSFYSEGYADPDPATWIIDRKQRPDTWWQREETPDLGNRDLRKRAQRAPVASRSVERRLAVQRAPREDAPQVTERPVHVASREITRIEPERVAKVIADAGLSKAQAAERYGVSVSRINELTTHVRPKSWLNAERWEDFQEAMRG
jgi:site-specific DNA-cytosine methylase